MKRFLALMLIFSLAAAPLSAAKKPLKKKGKSASSAKKTAANPQEEASAHVVQVEGKVMFKRHQGSWEKASLGLNLHKLDMLKTYGDGKVKLLTPEGANIALGQNSEISLGSLSSETQPRTSLQLIKGFLRALIDKKLENRSFEVYQSNAVAAVKGTDLVAENNGNSMHVQVLSSQHSGVQLGGWDGSSTLIRPGEKGVIGKDGVVKSEPLSRDDLDKANKNFSGLIPDQPKLITPPKDPAPVIPKPSAAEHLAAVQKAVETNFGNKVSDAVKEKMVADLVSSQAGTVLIEHLLQDASEGSASVSSYSQVAKDQGLNVDIKELDVIKPPKANDTPSPAGGGPTKTEAPAATQAPAPQSSVEIAKEIQQTLADLKQDIATNASADQAALRNDLLDGNTWIDRKGYRSETTQLVLRPDASTVDKVIVTKRSNGPDSGKSIFSHTITFNKPLPLDWTTIYGRSLNSPDNLAATGSPEYWRTFEQISFASPSGCKACMFDSYGAPQFETSYWAQDDLKQYSVMGLDRGFQQFYANGAAPSGNNITVAVTQTQDNAWQLDYFNQTLGVAIFSAKVWLVGKTGALEDPLKFGSASMTSLGDFSILESNHIHEIELNAPEFLGTPIDVLIPSDAFLEAF